MFQQEIRSLFQILDESPLFVQLSIKERASLLNELMRSYPQLFHQSCEEMDVGYEASWLRQEIR